MSLSQTEKKIPHSRLIQTTVVVAAMLASTLAAATAALATTPTVTRPTAPILDYAEGFQCGSLIVGMQSSTSPVNSEFQLRYEVFDNGKPIGPAVDVGNGEGVWAWFQNDVLTPGPTNKIYAEAEDTYGNWSAPSNADVVYGYSPAGNPNC
jgi:hypothetical protein